MLLIELFLSSRDTIKNFQNTQLKFMCGLYPLGVDGFWIGQEIRNIKKSKTIVLGFKLGEAKLIKCWDFCFAQV